jgi:hypothetical protein
MKFLQQLSAFLLFVFIAFGFIFLGPNEPTYNGDASLSSSQMNANTISTWFRNNGSFNRNPVTGNSGFEWPKNTNKFVRYASGICIGAKFNSDTLVSYATYNYEYFPGFTDNSCVSQGKDSPDYRIYKLTYGEDDLDRMQWPNALLGNSDQGAPVFFDTQSNTWKAQDYGNQTMFYSMTESYPESHNYTQPIKIDIKQVNYAFNQTGPLQNTIFTQLKVVNRCGRTLNDIYIGFWTDDDIGVTATSDKGGCDSIRDLGYTYKGVGSDPAYGSMPPAVGTLLLKGADYYTGVNTDTVKFCDGRTVKTKVGYKLRKMESYIRYENGNPTYGDFANYRELYRNMN